MRVNAVPKQRLTGALASLVMGHHTVHQMGPEPGVLMCRQIDIASSELIKVMISRRKEGRRAISVLWLC